MKILIIRFSSIGDIILTTPVIRCLRKKLPAAEIHYLVKKKFEGIVVPNPYLDKVLVLQDDIRATIETIKNENFDCIIDLQNNLRTAKIRHSVRTIPSYHFNKLNIRKWIYTSFKVNLMPDQHIVDRYMETVKSFGVVNDGLGLDFFIPEKDAVNDSDIPYSHSQGFISIAIGAAHFTKKLPVDKLKKLCAYISYPVILLGGKEDFYNGFEIAKVDPARIYNACGKFTLTESADIIRRSKLVISHDTGLMHIAAAFKKHVLSVWGNTVPSFGMYPYQTTYEVFQVNKLWCRPCSKIGFDKCPLGHFKCMRQIPVEKIVQTTNQFLKK